MSSFEVEVFFDGACPLCVREISLLRRLDGERGRIRFTDIQAPGFDATAVGLSYSELMRKIHGRLPNGTCIEGVEVFRRLYAAVGFGRLVAFTRLPGVSGVLDFAYERFAEHRLRLTGRCTPDSCTTSPSAEAPL